MPIAFGQLSVGVARALMMENLLVQILDVRFEFVEKKTELTRGVVEGDVEDEKLTALVEVIEKVLPFADETIRFGFVDVGAALARTEKLVRLLIQGNHLSVYGLREGEKRGP